MNLLPLITILIFTPIGSTLAQKSELKVKDFPSVEITFTGKKSATNCKLDSLVEVYICDNDGNPILVKNNYGNFMAIGRDSLNKSAREFNVKSIKAI